MKRRSVWQYLGDWGMIGLIIVIGTLINYRYEIRGSHFVDLTTLQTTSGTVVDARVTQSTSSSFSPVVTYAYTVNDSRYTTSNHSFTHVSFRDAAEAQNYLAAYPVGKTITVFYAPNDPSFATLRPQSQGDFSWGAWVGGLASLSTALAWSRRPVHAKRHRVQGKARQKAST